MHAYRQDPVAIRDRPNWRDPGWCVIGVLSTLAAVVGIPHYWIDREPSEGIAFALCILPVVGWCAFTIYHLVRLPVVAVVDADGIELFDEFPGGTHDRPADRDFALRWEEIGHLVIWRRRSITGWIYPRQVYLRAEARRGRDPETVAAIERQRQRARAWVSPRFLLDDLADDSIRFNPLARRRLAAAVRRFAPNGDRHARAATRAPGRRQTLDAMNPSISVVSRS